METKPQKTGPIEILFSYAREDEMLRDKLEKHLGALKRGNRIVCWHDRNIRAGNIWSLEVSTHLNTADIILLLVSSDFIDSDYCNNVEVKRALERHGKGEVCVVPIILRPSDWKDQPFAKFQALPRDARPVMEWSRPDNALYNIANGIKEIVVEMEKARSSSQ